MYVKLKNEKWLENTDRPRACDKLLALRKQLAEEIPSRSVKDSLLLATWNIRDFGGKGFNPGPRLPEAYYYMAEIISAFDLVALQEVNEDMTAFFKLMGILGPAWSYIATDTTEGTSGNGERMVFVYDKGKVQFLNIAGEIVLPKADQVQDEDQFARTPFLVKFQTGWLKFNLCTVHLYYGEDKGKKKERRVAEIDAITKFLKKRGTKDNENYILLGDMNVVGPGDETMDKLIANKFILPTQILVSKIPNEFASNMNKDKFYDQIAFFNKKNELELSKKEKSAGVFNFYKSVYIEDDSEIYYPLGLKIDKKDKKTGQTGWANDVGKRKTYYSKKWRTWQMSDHLPLWVELKIDFSEKYLNYVKNTSPKPILSETEKLAQEIVAPVI